MNELQTERKNPARFVIPGLASSLESAMTA
jgi:hypothetical protein